MKKLIYSILVSVFFMYSCEDESKMAYYAENAQVPSGIITGSAKETFGVGAIIEGEVTSDGGAEIQCKGICYSGTNTTPTLTQDPGTGSSDGSISQGTGSFSASVLNLIPDKTYYYRTYALNAAGIAYGEVKTFNSGKAPIVIASFQSQFFEDTWDVNVEAVPSIPYYNVIDMYEEGYNVRLTLGTDGKTVTIAKQPAWVHATYGIASVEGTGTFDGKVFKLLLKHSVSAGTFNPNPASEIITLP
ncbi:MAG: hypothetical protein LBU57_04930 [Dysgonamonadaceae bacterium]|jgi:hypothetical protein|nr:hypothetical protein [Dysgonamonadaceae bacterium]